MYWIFRIGQKAQECSEQLTIYKPLTFGNKADSGLRLQVAVRLHQAESVQATPNLELVKF